MHSFAFSLVLAALLPSLALCAPPRGGSAAGFDSSAGTAAPPPEQLRYSAMAESHRVRELPGYDGELPVRMFAGNFSVPPGRELFYIFVEAAERPKDAPVVMWLTG